MPNWCDEIVLIKPAEARAKDTQGFVLPPKNETKRVVFANKKSVGHTEVYESDIAGVKAVHKFDIYAAEYSGEQILEYEGERYYVTHDYSSPRYPDKIELTVSRVQGGS